jgi:mono/diheme cytochrome c family protein/regulation of enolase protein 1 (concanavalin A-like superfamily)
LTKSGASPARSAAATLPAAAIAGRTIFKTQNCASCHGGAQFTNSALNVFRNVGTIKQPTSGQRLGATLPGFDVPTLRGLWATAPYLHDGSAATIDDAIRAHSGVTLSDADLANLAAYVANIDDDIAAAPTRLTLVLSTPLATVGGAFTVTATFSGPATGVTLADIAVTNGTATNLVGAGASYSFTVTPAVFGAVSVSVADGMVQDADGDAGLASNTLAVTYQQVNRAPTITAIGNRSTVRGQSVSLQVQASDPDGQALTYTAAGLPAGLSINTSGLISGTVSAGAAATNSVTVTVSDGSLSASTSFTWSTTAPPVLALTGRDIGSPGRTGSNSVSGGVYTVTGSGTDIWGTSDKFRFVSQTFTGDGEIIVRVTSQTNTNPWAKAGIMFRETLNANSRHAMMVLTPSNGTAFQYRTATAGTSLNVSAASVPAPNNWLRLTRRGNIFTGYRSSDGVTWTQVGTATIPMAAAINVGLCVTSHANTTRSTATFDNLQLRP